MTNYSKIIEDDGYTYYPVYIYDVSGMVTAHPSNVPLKGDGYSNIMIYSDNIDYLKSSYEFRKMLKNKLLYYNGKFVRGSMCEDDDWSYAEISISNIIIFRKWLDSILFIYSTQSNDNKHDSIDLKVYYKQMIKNIYNCIEVII